MKNISTIFASAALTTIFLSSCAQTGNHDVAEVDAAYLQYADENARSAVADARAEVSIRRDELAAAKLKLEDVQKLRDIASEQADVVEERVELAEARSEAANSEKVIEASNDITDERELELAAAEGRVAVYERVCDARKANISLAQARVDYAEASVGLASARAVRNIDRADSPEVSVEKHARAVRAQATQVKIAQTEFDAAVREVRLASEKISSDDGSSTLFPEMQREIDALLDSGSL